MVDVLTCPICATTFASGSEGAAFALHVVDCTTSLSSSAAAGVLPFQAEVVNGLARASASSTSPLVQSCSFCHHVYATGTAEHVVDFHEHECARANKRRGGKATSSVSSSSGSVKLQGKRPREVARSTTTTTSTASTTSASDATAGAVEAPDTEDVDMEADVPPKVTLFPSHCALCGSGGRSLLHCSGSCARVFHAACVDDVQPGSSSSSRSATVTARATGSGSAQSQWTCAECARGVHPCQLCGFLGHESNTMRKCALADCGFFFHTSCLQASQQDPDQSDSICPRHTCSKCGTVEKDMRRCVSCTECFSASHLKCPGDEEEVKQSGSESSASVQDSTLLHVCDKHTSAATASSTTRSGKPSSVSEEQTLALKYRVQQGDIVLILELANAILPPSAKNAAPDAINQWGVVTRAETIDARNQLLSISIFSDGSVIAVPNRYALSLGSANAFSSPQIMLRDCIKWHVVNELNLRHAELDALVADNVKKEEKRDDILNASCSAFYARAEKLSLSISQLFAAAKAGYIYWETHREELTQLEGSGAPIYVFMDTRSASKSSSASTAATSSG